MKRLHYFYDEDRDIMTIEGINYAGDYFRTLGKNGHSVNQLFRFEKHGETLTIAKLDAKYHLDPKMKAK